MTRTCCEPGRPRSAGVGLALFLILLAADASGQPAPRADGEDARALIAGHWVRVKGKLEDASTFAALSVEVLAPQRSESLLGTVPPPGTEGGFFVLLGQRVRSTARTSWEGLAPDGLAGARIKVEGHWRTSRRFDARQIRARPGAGRDRIEGRIDAVVRRGDVIELRVMRWRVRVSADLLLDLSRPLGEIALAPVQIHALESEQVDDEDEIPRKLALTDTISYGVLAEISQDREAQFDLDSGRDDDRRTRELSLRMELVYEPGDAFYALARLRHRTRWRSQDGEAHQRDIDPDLSELYGYWRDPFGAGVDLQVGRQDFDDAREWLYDENLDAVRAIWVRPGMRLEVSASSVLADGGPRNRDRVNYMAVLSNNDDRRTLAAYVIDRRDLRGAEDKPIHIGVRALGEWFPYQRVWAEASVLRGFDAAGDLRGTGVDLGTTWSPPWAEPFYFTIGVAQGSGDDDPTDDVNEAFRQTGLQDNNGRFGGVTSFRYYGELMDPELTNLSIWTLGVGTRLTRLSSLDLVLHRYRQVEAAPGLGRSQLSATPNGVDRDLGWGMDLILGLRDFEPWDLEVVLAGFQAGDAFGGADDAWLGKVQLRYRF